MKQLFFLILVTFLVIKSSGQNQFVTLWDTRLRGVTSDNQVEYIFETLEYADDYSIKTPKITNTTITWEKYDNPGVNGKATLNAKKTTITFPEPGVYKITQNVPTFPEKTREEFHTEYESYSDLFDYLEDYKIIARRKWRWEEVYIGDAPKLIDVLQWGNIYCDGTHLFNGCSNLDVSATDAPIFSGSCKYTFKDCTKLKGNAAFNKWSMCKVFYYNSMFENCPVFNAPITNWCMFYAVETTNMFSGASSFNQPIGQWQFTRNLKSIDRMFYNARSFAQDLTKWSFRYKSVSDYQAFIGTISKEKNWLPGETIDEFTANYIAEQNKKTQEQRDSEDCEMSLKGRFEAIRSQYEAAKTAFENETQHNLTNQDVSGKLNDVIQSLRSAKENLNFIFCKNYLGVDAVTKLTEVINEKIAMLEESKRQYDEGNKKLSFLEALVLGLQVGTGAYDK